MEGFFDNFKTEFGKKTGKALGNALYGDYAEDKRIGVRVANSSSKKDDKNHYNEATTSAKSYKEVETSINDLVAQKIYYQRQSVMDIDFDPDDPKQIFRQMSNLATTVEFTLKNDSDYDDGVGVAAESKFKAGLALIKFYYSGSPMVDYFKKLPRGWKLYRLKKQLSKHKVVVIVACFILLSLLIYIIEYCIY